MDFLISLFEKIKRFFSYGMLGWKTVDFDCHSTYDIINFKLQRAYDIFLKYGHLEWNASKETKGMKRLREAIHLSKRLANDDYLIEALSVHEKKYGKRELVNFKFNYLEEIWNEEKEIPKERLKTAICRYKKDNSSFTSQTLRDLRRDSHLMLCFKKAELIQKQDRDRFFKLLNKNLEGWWD